MKINRELVLGTIAVVISSIAYGVQPIYSSILIQNGIPETVLYMYYAAFSILTFGGICLVTGQSVKVEAKLFGEIALIALCGNTLMEILFSFSFRYISVAMTELFHFSYPAIVILLMVVVFRQKLTGIKVVAVALAFAGVMLITDLSSSLSFWGCFFGVASGFVYGIYIIANDRSRAAQLPMPVLLFWVVICSTVFFVIINLVTGTPMGFPSIRSGVLTAICSQTGSVLPIFAMAYGVRRLGASRTVLLNNLEPLVGVILSTIIFRTGVTWRLILACVCILGCSVMSGFVEDTK